jgi:hypothetical protein
MSWHVIGVIPRLAVGNIFRQGRRIGRLCLRKSEKKTEKRRRMT